VISGPSFRQSDRGAFCLNLQNEQEYDSLFNSLGKLEGNSLSLVYLPSIVRHVARAGSSMNAGGLSLAFVQFLALTKAMGKLKAPIEVLIATRGAQQMSGADTTERGAGLLAAFCAVIPQEFRNVRCRLLDFPMGTASDRLLDREIDGLLGEFPFQGQEQLVAYRGNHRWTRDFRPIDLGKQDWQAVRDDNRVYLLVGGLGKSAWQSLRPFRLFDAVSSPLSRIQTFPRENCGQNMNADR